VIAASRRVQWLWLAASALLHVILSWAGWYAWLQANRVIDGGALGFLTWTIPTLAGSLTWIHLEEQGRTASYRPFLIAGALCMAAGYAISCLTNGGVWAAPPFVPPWHPVDMWTMSQRAGSASYLTFATGFSLWVFTFFLWWSDERGGRWGLFRTFGTNALAAYILHGLVQAAVKPFAPKDSPAYWFALTFLIFFGISYLFVRSLEKNGIFLKL
jgi:hypothetical protein